MNKWKLWLYIVMPLAGLLFCLYYINIAWLDVIYTDYIRIVCYYLPDVYDFNKFLVPDILTRIPVNYLERIINVELFGFDTRFDMFLCALGLTGSAWIMAWYCLKEKLATVWYVIILLLMFSLNKWEMLINGTGWVHFAAFVCFYYHYMVADRYLLKQNPKPYDSLRLKVLPFLIVCLIAGPYCAIYCLVLMLLYGLVMIMEKRETGRFSREYLVYIVCTLIPLILYMISNSYVTEPLKDVCTDPIFIYFLKDPVFFVKFFIKSFGSMVIGVEVAELLSMTGTQTALLGAVVILGYLGGLFLYWREKLYKKSWFPLILMVSGGLNHLLILYSRWRFLRDIYGMSSRYALQFQVGIFGILLTLALALRERNSWKIRKKAVVLAGTVCLCGILLVGNYKTTYWEIKKAPGRQSYAQTLIELAYDLDNLEDEKLIPFQYSYLERTRTALEILREHGWNVYRPDYRLPAGIEPEKADKSGASH